jgi:hypothetical protein
MPAFLRLNDTHQRGSAFEGDDSGSPHKADGPATGPYSGRTRAHHRTRAFPHLPIDSACVTAAPSQYNCLASRPCVLLPLAGVFGAAIAASRHMLQSDSLPRKGRVIIERARRIDRGSRVGAPRAGLTAPPLNERQQARLLLDRAGHGAARRAWPRRHGYARQAVRPRCRCLLSCHLPSTGAGRAAACLFMCLLDLRVHRHVRPPGAPAAPALHA